MPQNLVSSDVVKQLAREVAIKLVLAHAPSSIEPFRRGLTHVHGAAVIDALPAELAFVRDQLETFCSRNVVPAKRKRGRQVHASR
jgi:hypothetical protein